jgi:hypothetical protein
LPSLLANSTIFFGTNAGAEKDEGGRTTGTAGEVGGNILPGMFSLPPTLADSPFFVDADAVEVGGKGGEVGGDTYAELIAAAAYVFGAATVKWFC